MHLVVLPGGLQLSPNDRGDFPVRASVHCFGSTAPDPLHFTALCTSGSPLAPHLAAALSRALDGSRSAKIEVSAVQIVVQEVEEAQDSRDCTWSADARAQG